MSTMRIGIIGGGLMGRELASAIGRWFVLENFPVQASLTAVCDISEPVRNWFKKIPGVSLTADYHELLKRDDVDVVYVAVPHHLHEQIYLDVLKAGKDMLAEKPFGIDLPASRRIAAACKSSGRFVRCSSEFPFLPGAMRVAQFVKQGNIGKPLQVNAGFWHASDLDPTKPINWKRQVKFCGEIGVMGDLGMHVAHMPLRFGWKPKSVFGQLQKIYTQRPDGKGGMAECDTWDNAIISSNPEVFGSPTPMRMEMKRLAPGETNTWFIEVLGTDAGIRYSTKEPKTLWLFSRAKEQLWTKIDLGFTSYFPTITGGIFEPGFPDYFLQMWAAFAAERAGALGDRFGCGTPEEAAASHEIFAAALQSHKHQQIVATEAL